MLRWRQHAKLLVVGDGDISILGLVSCVTTTTKSVRQLAVWPLTREGLSTRMKGLKGLGMRVFDVKGFEPTGGE